LAKLDDALQLRDQVLNSDTSGGGDKPDGSTPSGSTPTDSAPTTSGG
jgi:hypothetical protein